jgi:DNA repair photolyase
MSKRHPEPLKGRGSASRPDERYQALQREWCDDGWGSLETLPQRLETTLEVDRARTLISYNDSPDVGFDRSINPYRGCEHGCIYCFARPSHAWLGLSPGLDFESRLFYKPEAASLLRKELGKRNYRCAPMAVGINTDAYQPVEKKLGITRQCLAVLSEAHHPIAIVTKSALIERDLDLLVPMAERKLVQVAVSLTTLDRDLSRRMEPRAAAPQRRLETIRRLSEARIPVMAFIAPVIPVLTDHELEKLLSAAREAGAKSAAYVLLRLPHELNGLFVQWLEQHEPLKAERVLQRIYDSRGGKAYDASFGQRMVGSGPFADLIRQRFRLAVKRLGYGSPPPLDVTQFVPPPAEEGQLSLF